MNCKFDIKLYILCISNEIIISGFRVTLAGGILAFKLSGTEQKGKAIIIFYISIILKMIFYVVCFLATQCHLYFTFI